ncbi:MAG: protein tyrosine phosphatase family protein [Gammaproteobacteria bacterium]|nr:protein tyrosine phosphatase family protein [Gammaproteobacteria bacterium]
MDNLEQIYNYEKVTEHIGSSGQPTRDQFGLIKDAGYDAVINLALPTSDTALPDEGSVVTALEMGYHHIPVKFDDPTVDDLRIFFGVMHALEQKKVWVHCVVNARVSAFLYHYLRYSEDLDERAARTTLLDRWEPEMDDVWRSFLSIRKEEII